MTAPAGLPHRDAVLAALQGAGLVVGDGVAPSLAQRPASGAFAVLYASPGRAVRESLADQRTDWHGVMQVTCVGPTAERALWVADRAAVALHGPLAVVGRVTWRAEVDDDPPPVQRDDDESPPLFYVPLQFTLRSTSA